MIKKSLLLLTLPLMICSCGSEKVYKNVSYEFNMDEHKYIVSLVDGTKNKEWKVEPKNVYFITTYYYNYDFNDPILNEFFVKGSSYKLYVYNYK